MHPILPGGRLGAVLVFLLFALTARAGAAPAAPDSGAPWPTAVLDFEARGLAGEDATILTERFRVELAPLGHYRLLERSRMNEILKEQGFQQTGCTSSECAVQTGRLLGVRRMVAGSISRLGGSFTLTARELDVESGEILRSASLDLPADLDTLLRRGMGELARRLCQDAPATNATARAAPAAPRRAPAPGDSARRLRFDFSGVAEGLDSGFARVPGSEPLQVVVGVLPLPRATRIAGFSLNIGYGELKELRGLQIGLANQTTVRALGLQFGAVNLGEAQKGVQLGLLNATASFSGIQAGLLNSAPRDTRGLQLGLVNIAGPLQGLQVGLINLWGPKGRRRVFPVLGGLW